MLYIAENIRALRKSIGFTQDEVAEMMSVSPQSVSKWERGDTYPDITLLPALANLFKTSIDSLVGMDKINDEEARSAIFRAEHEYLQAGELQEAVKILENARKTFPNDVNLLSEHALVLSLFPEPENLKKSVAFCEQVLAGNPSEKVRHTVRAALCFIYLKLGETQKSQASAQNLPHVRESRETILSYIQDGMTPQQIDNYLRLITLGDEDDQDIICIDFGIDMLPIAKEHHLLERIRDLRDQQGENALPKIRVRDNMTLPPKLVRLRHYAEYLICREFDDPEAASDELMKRLQCIVTDELGKRMA